VINSGAVLSECRRYRYRLWRQWDESRPWLTFIGVNPSTADETTDDQTIRKCVSFTKLWGFGALEMINLFAWRSPDPEALLTADNNPIGEGMKNDESIIEACERADRVVMAWGSHKKIRRLLQPREDAVRLALLPKHAKELGHLGLNGDGSPRHPLYLPKSTPFQPWSTAQALSGVSTRDQLRAIIMPLRAEHDSHYPGVAGCPFCEGAIT
jgi:hypothetical protein